MSNPIYLKTYQEPPLSINEIYRYAQSAEDPQLDKKINLLLKECIPMLTYKVCYSRLPIRCTENMIDLQFANFSSKDLFKNLKGCKEIILFAATIGLPFDRLLAKYSRLSPADAIILQAIGTERIEALADAFEKDLEPQLISEQLRMRPRFSPGYGDLPLSLQREIFQSLNCKKNIGVALNSQMLMTPSKSITALIGLEEIS